MRVSGYIEKSVITNVDCVSADTVPTLDMASTHIINPARIILRRLFLFITNLNFLLSTICGQRDK
jgi:hypothetical protein